MANAAIQVELLMSGLTDSNGNALASGKIFTYDAGTSNNKTTWIDAAKGSAATNPVILDANGRALIFADGIYKFVVKDSDDVTLYTWDSLEYGLQIVVLPEVSAPSGIANKGQFTTFDDAGDTEGRYTDDTGRDTQITKDGTLNAMAKVGGGSTDNQAMRWDGVGGDTPQGSLMVIDDSGNVTGVVDLTTTGGLVINGSITGVSALTASGIINAGSLVLSGTITGATDIVATGTLIGFPNLPSGATQVGSGAGIGELWVTSGHATQEDNTVMRGV